MSFGFSAGDFVILLQLARTSYKNCVEAGPEYVEIAREVKSLYAVLKTLRDEAEKSNSVFNRDPDSASKVLAATDGCKRILEDLQTLLAKYAGLSGDGEAVNATRKLWHRFGFGTKIEQLGAVRGKIITYTSTISVLLDTIQLKATGRIEERMETGFAEIMDNFEFMRKAICNMAIKARAAQLGGSSLSLLSLSTYAEDDKEVWQEFRRELINRGFRSKQLDRHKDLLQAYMLKLDQSKVLDELPSESGVRMPGGRSAHLRNRDFYKCLEFQ
jgi:hypothetical protein